MNKGISIEKIAKQYEYTPEVVRNIIQNAGYTYNPYYQKWEQTKKPSQSDEKVEIKEVINTDVMPLEDINESCANNNIQKPISGKHVYCKIKVQSFAKKKCRELHFINK